jgi:DNA-directed RNA polymerase subunit beta'
LIEDGAKVKPGQKMAEWDPLHPSGHHRKRRRRAFLRPRRGRFGHRTDGRSHRYFLKIVIDWRSQPKGSDLKPRMALLDKKGKIIKLPNGLPANYYLSVDTIL